MVKILFFCFIICFLNQQYPALERGSLAYQLPNDSEKYFNLKSCAFKHWKGNNR